MYAHLCETYNMFAKLERNICQLVSGSRLEYQALVSYELVYFVNKEKITKYVEMVYKQIIEIKLHSLSLSVLYLQLTFFILKTSGDLP